MQNTLKATVYHFYLSVLGYNLVLQRRYRTEDKQTHTKAIAQEFDTVQLITLKNHDLL